MAWEGEYQIVRWRPMSVVFVKKPPKDLKLKGNASPMPMIYKPKLNAIFSWRCRQTIRKGRKYAVGQVRWVFEWSGKPYRSKWGRRMLVEIVQVDDCLAHEAVIQIVDGLGRIVRGCYWHDQPADRLAAADHIDPPTGVELRNVLKGLNKERT